MDFEGQKLAEKLYHWILNGFGVLALLVGYGAENVYHMWYTFLAGIVVSCVVCVPPWPFYSKNPLPWQTKVSDSEKKKK